MLSKEKRHGFLKPRLQTCCAPPKGNGLMMTLLQGAPVSGLRRRSFPSNEDRLCPLLFGSPSIPPSPMPAYRHPSGPNASMPPLWFEKVGLRVMVSRITAEAGLARSEFTLA